ncbi:MAG: phosphoribosylformylglycinamidine synthase subunit PurQ [Nitrospinae bacterium]|nr:phosphoribosylformylglycinamidine synthase subunit PurQ [Nitrospinota bacterium]
MKFAVIEFPGSNCDHDFYHAAKHALGCETRFVWHQERDLSGFDVVILPGGFSFGDYLRAGAIARFSPIMAEVARHAKRGGYVLGVCNGFQILTEAGLLPGALTLNHGRKFICADMRLRVETANSFVTRGLEKGRVITVPIAHMEGRYIADEGTLRRLNGDDRVLLRYCDGQGAVTDQANPNGAAENIAGILSEGRNVAGMMPHPERVVEKALGGEDGLLILNSILSRAA